MTLSTMQEGLRVLWAGYEGLGSDTTPDLVRALPDTKGQHLSIARFGKAIALFVEKQGPWEESISHGSREQRAQQPWSIVGPVWFNG